MREFTLMLRVGMGCCLVLLCAGICRAQDNDQTPHFGEFAATWPAEQPAPRPLRPTYTPQIGYDEGISDPWLVQAHPAAGRADASTGASHFASLASRESSKTQIEQDSVTFRNGVQFSFPSTSSKAHIGALIQQDWVFFSQDDELRNAAGIGDLQEAVYFRRARIRFDGTAHDFIEWDFDCELLASSQVTFDDLWIGVKSIPGVGNIRVGHIKLPQGLESITSNRVFTFLERSAQHDAFYREYGPGLMMFNNYAGDDGQWSLAFHRQDAASDGVHVGDGEYAATGRLTAIPYSADDDEVLVHLGVSSSVRAASWDPSKSQRVVRFRTRPEFRIARQTPTFLDTGLIAADRSVVLGTEAALIHGPLSLQAEYTASGVTGRDPAMAGGFDDDLWFHGGFVQLSYFLTGEHRPYDRRLARLGNLSPKSNVSRGTLLGGAWELAGRYTWVNLNDRDVQGGELDGWTAGLNWYWNPYYRMQFNYVLTERDATGGDGQAHGFLMRFSLNL